MLKDRNLTVHIYTEETAQPNLANICNRYLAHFQRLRVTLQQLLAVGQ